MAKKKIVRKRGGGRMLTAWYDYQLAHNTQSGTQDGITRVVSADEIIPQPATPLQFGKKQWLKVLRMILKLLMFLTSTGAEAYVKVLVGIRIVKEDMDGTLPTAADQPNLQNTDSDSRRVDWWYRDTLSAYLPATSGNEASGASGGVPLELKIDFKPNRELPPGYGLVVHTHILNMGSVTNSDAVMTADLTGRLLLGKKGGM